MMNALIGNGDAMHGSGGPVVAVGQSNVLESVKTVFKKDPPEELTRRMQRGQRAAIARFAANA